MADTRCDAGLPSGKRCKNDATKWIHLSFQPNDTTVEDWPVAVCDVHAAPNGSFLRLGPDRRAEYASQKDQSHDDPVG